MSVCKQCGLSGFSVDEMATNNTCHDCESLILREKFHRASAEIGRLRAENERLKAEIGMSLIHQDRAYIAGMSTGWNLGVVEDCKKYERLVTQKHKEISEAKQSKLQISDCGCRFENEYSGAVILCDECASLPCHTGECKNVPEPPKQEQQGS